MASKRQPSKQRRQSQNQKQRAALEARRAAASAAPAGGSRDTGAGTDASEGSPPPAGRSVLSRLRAAPSAGRAARPRASGQAVGHRAALSALLAAVAAVLIVWFANPVPLDRSGDPIVTQGALVGEWSLSAREAIADAPEGESTEDIAESVDDWLPGGTERYLLAAWPTSLLAVLPVIGTALGFRAVTRRSSAKIVNRTMYVTLFGALLAGPALILFLPAVISLGVAAYQVRKAEVAAQAAEPDAADDGDDDDDDDATDIGEVIDVDEVVEPEGAAERH